MKNNVFRDQKCDKGCFVTVQTNSQITDERSTFSNAEATSTAGAIFFSDSSATFTGSKFKNNSSNIAGDIKAMSLSTLVISGGIFENSSALSDDGPASIEI